MKRSNKTQFKRQDDSENKNSENILCAQQCVGSGSVAAPEPQTKVKTHKLLVLSCCCCCCSWEAENGWCKACVSWRSAYAGLNRAYWIEPYLVSMLFVENRFETARQRWRIGLHVAACVVGTAEAGTATTVDSHLRFAMAKRSTVRRAVIALIAQDFEAQIWRKQRGCWRF